MEGMTPLVACDAAVMNPAKIESCDKLARHYHKDPKKLSADLKERYAGLDLSTPCLSLLVYAVECTPEGRKNKQAAAELSRTQSAFNKGVCTPWVKMNACVRLPAAEQR